MTNAAKRIQIHPSLHSVQTCAVLILAAGNGKRMGSHLPKVLQPIAGKPLLFHVLSQVLRVLPTTSIGIVVGYQSEVVQDYVRREPLFQNKTIDFILQSQQQGTGHAVRCAMESPWGQARLRNQDHILVLPGDLPLMTPELLKEMMIPLKKSEALRLLTGFMPNPFGYGRIIREKKGGLILKIMEEADASETEKKIQEVAVSIYLFQSDFLNKFIKKLSHKNKQQEYYLTEILMFAIQSKQKIATHLWAESEDLRGVNNPLELLQANQLMNDRLIRYWSNQGVFFSDMHSIYIDITVQLKKGVQINSGVILKGMTIIEEKSIIGPHVVLENVQIGQSVHIKTGTVGIDSKINHHAQVGPYAHLRPGSVVGEKTKIGNFVELKNATIGPETHISHLSYVGDAQIGKKVNIGCGFITCNFDGQKKHRTIIEDDVFLGSDCQVIAPVKIERGAYIASGSTITEDIPKGAFAIARARQVIKLNYAQKFKSKMEKICAES